MKKDLRNIIELQCHLLESVSISADEQLLAIKKEIDALCSCDVGWAAASIIIEIEAKGILENLENVYDHSIEIISYGVENNIKLKDPDMLNKYEFFITRWKDEYIYKCKKIKKYFKESDSEKLDLALKQAYNYINFRVVFNDAVDFEKPQEYINKKKFEFCEIVKKDAKLHSLGYNRQTRAYIEQCKNDCIRFINDMTINP